MTSVWRCVVRAPRGGFMDRSSKTGGDAILRYRNFKRPFSLGGRVRMNRWVVKGASGRSRIGDLSGDSSVRGARIRGVLASRASAGQRRLSARGVEPGGARPGIRRPFGNRSNGRAGDRGGARADKPRWVSNRVCCEAILGFQGVLDLSMAFMMLSSLCMQATITTLAGFPAALSVERRRG